MKWIDEKNNNFQSLQKKFIYCSAEVKESPSDPSLTCDGVVVVGGVGEGLQQVSLVLKCVVDFPLKVLEPRDEVLQRALCVRMVQHAAGRDLQPAVHQLHSWYQQRRVRPSLHRQHLHTTATGEAEKHLASSFK